MEKETKEKLLETCKEIGAYTGCVTEKYLKLDDKIEEIENPLNAVLLYYCFSEILGVEFWVSPIEKVRYMAYFQYKGHICKVVDRKFEYAIYLEREIKAELIEVLQKVRLELSELLLEKGKKAYECNSFRMPNQIHMYERKIEQRREHVLECYNKQLIYEQNNKEILPILPSENAAAVERGLEDLGWDPNIEWSNFVWAVEDYMSTVYSYIEHLETLLIPFTGLKNIHRKMMSGWKTKAKLVWGEDIYNKDFMKNLISYKERYRNRVEHGYFSTEMKIEFKLEGVGYYPIFVGKGHLLGLEEENEYCIDKNVFDKFEEAFRDLIEYNKKKYDKAMVYINSGFEVPTDILNDFADIKTVHEAKQYVMRLWEMNENMN